MASVTGMKRLLTGLLLGVVAGAAQAQAATGPLTVEDRVYPRPQSSAATDNRGDASPRDLSAQPQGGVMMLMQQMQQYEEELQRLQGQIEELRHELERGREAERARYVDLDTRINAVAEASLDQSATAQAAADATEQANGSGASGANGASPESDRAAYAAAREKLLARDFPEAGKAFEQYLSDYSQGQFRPFAHFWLGEIYRSQATPDRAGAMKQFQTVVDDYPDHSQVPAALYKLATLQAESGDTNRARVTLNRIVQQYEGTSEARLAQGMLDQLK